MIIDSGSDENFVVNKLIFAFNLETESHPNPYKIGLIKKGEDTRVNEIFSDPLLIGGSYKDQIVCNVLNMDVYHILIGRPWQYNTNQSIREGRIYMSFSGWTRR